MKSNRSMAMANTQESVLPLSNPVEPENEQKQSELGRETLKEISNLKKDILGLSSVLKVYYAPSNIEYDLHSHKRERY